MKKYRTGTRVRGGYLFCLFCVGVMLWGVAYTPAWASRPLKPLPIPVYSFDLESPAIDTGDISADTVLAAEEEGPLPVFYGVDMGLGRSGDELNALSGAHSHVASTETFALLFSVDRDSASANPVDPDPDLVDMGVPYNASDQAIRGHAAGDLNMSTMLFTRRGKVSPGDQRPPGNNLLVINNFDEGGTDFKANPATSARDRTPGALQDNVDATCYISSNGTARNLSPNRDGSFAKRSPYLFFSVAEGSPSLDYLPTCPPPPPPPPPASSADVFFDGDPSTADCERCYAQAYEHLGLQEQGDDIDALIVFDINTNSLFDFGDQVFFSLSPNSVSLQLLDVSPADVISVTFTDPLFPDPPEVFAFAEDLGLAPEDNIDALEFVFCEDVMECARLAGIRLVQGDFDNDGDVDLIDYAEFVGCMSGPWQGAGFMAPDLLCLEVFDADTDEDVDLEDFSAFQAYFVGER
ncbi:MAG: hypothetical protein KAV82_07970 [Phycisphaerae bacterium]|nr:hypothetical protein [Phycisphaerae bacterium]